MHCLELGAVCCLHSGSNCSGSLRGAPDTQRPAAVIDCRHGWSPLGLVCSDSKGGEGPSSPLRRAGDAEACDVDPDCPLLD
ncbi:hypothetical protein NDU88_005086 [Pleurodeles waltl]|uniref:Uncharacterized protein n=1 Tax=Pleurodeles waltl TaxID=8319 RepID=A0AAV7LLP7_PLEWA|nr:hypothetical protein NDU88_005086 [Pleurodeles waltl]